MTATTPEPTFAPGDLDVSSTARVPFLRLLRVELRKMADTRAGFWLLVAIVLITAAVMLIMLATADADQRVFGNFMGIAATPQGFLLPVLGILLVTSEWSQRTAMTTFVLEPSRGRVLGSKTAAALVFGAAAFVIAVVLAALITAVAGTDGAFEGVAAGDFGAFFLLQELTILQGLAYGMLFLNTPAAIVTFFVLPLAFSVVANLVGWVRDSAAWIDLGTAQAPLFENGADLTGEQWAQLGTTSLIWIVVPFLVGLWRMLRAEVK